MGATSARHARDIIANTRRIVAIEFLTAAQALELRQEQPSPATGAAHGTIRKQVPPLGGDRPLYGDIETITTLICNGDILAAVEETIGPLQAPTD